MKRSVCILLLASLLFCLNLPAAAASAAVKSDDTNLPGAEILSAYNTPDAITAAEEALTASLSLKCVSALLMEAETGRILYEMNPDQALPPASVTKIMTLLLVMEAIDAGVIKLEEMLSCSANAASMGGSQVYLEEGEQMSVDELLKCVVISSANDAALMLAEAVAGSEEAFVARMNKRAGELGMKNSSFENTNGLDDTVVKHLTSARDVAIMSRELIRHPKILEYSSIWMDSIRDGAFGLTNTNRLVRFYRGATGLKTGSTSKAKFCISATAKRDGMHLICVIMAADTRDIRNAAATTLLDWGFANYALYVSEEAGAGEIRVTGGIDDSVGLSARRFSAVLPKGSESKVTRKVEIDETAAAPVKAGDRVGEVKYMLGEEEIGSSDIVCAGEVPKISFWQVLARIFSYFLIS